MAKPRATKVKKKGRAEPPAVEEPKRASVPPPKTPSMLPPTARTPTVPPRAAARWEERADKDAYALDLLDRLVRYYGGRASAGANDAMRSAAFVLSTLSLALATGDEAQLEALARSAREVRKSSSP